MNIRYANMDFIILSTLIGVLIAQLVLSYDIICQWSRNFGSRIRQFPRFMRLAAAIFVKIKYVIPKFHIYGHGTSCQYKFSLNFLKWSARIDGEDIERWWAHINPVSMSTKEMTPGARLGVLDDHAAAWNFRKITGFGMLYVVYFQLQFLHIYCRFGFPFEVQYSHQDAGQA
jgi:hypothetical protein